MPALHHPPTDAVADEILAQRVDLLDAALPLALLAVLLSAGVLGVTLWGAVDDRLLALWLGLVLGLSLLRWLAYRHLHRRGCGLTARVRLAIASAGLILSALTWGLASLWLFPVGDASHQAILAIIIAGICSGTVNALSAFRWLAWSYIGLSLVPFIARNLGTGSELGVGISVVTSLYLALLCLLAARYHRTLVDSLRMRYARERAEATIAQQAFYDGLTGLPNRRLLLDRLGRDVARAKRQGHSGAVLFLDIDRFKAVNDSLGHGVGDAVIRGVAERLSRPLRGDDTAARIGSDELVVVLAELAAQIDAAAHRARQIAEAIRTELAAPCRAAGHEVHVTASIGIALFPGDGEQPDELLRAAEIAMNRAKEAGRDTIRFYLPEMQAAAIARMDLERALRRALRERELKLHLQPQCDASGRVVAAEALLRWPGSAGMVAPPGVFVPVAEDCGLIHRLGDFVFDETFAIIRDLPQPEAPHGPRRIAVNVSPAQFRRPDFVPALNRRLAAAGIDPQLLELELTERIVVSDFTDTAAKMRELRGLGVHFSIDDFGTGHASLAYLKRLPLDALKIDRSFVRDVAHDPSDAAIVEAIIEMAHRLGLMVVAEGIDQQPILDFLTARGCDRYQGDLLHRPMPVADLLRCLDDQGPGRPVSALPGRR